jgi:glycosyltransferase involved in cell wall biosynthesis
MNISRKENRKALFISYYFPPDNAIGAVRIGKFSKYISEFGWNPIVLTVNRSDGQDTSLPVEIDESRIVRTSYYILRDLISKNSLTQSSFASNSSPRKSKFRCGAIVSTIDKLSKQVSNFPVIDELLYQPMGWYKPAVKAGIEIIKTHDIKVIFSSYYPAVSHIIAAKLNKLYGIPWVAEYRDPWSNNPYSNKIQPFSFLQNIWEKQTIKNCTTLVTVSPVMADGLKKMHSMKTVIIPNGFDEDDYKYCVSTTYKFSITYTGSIYPGKRDPSALFQALKELKQENLVSSRDIEVRFFGENIRKYITQIAEKYGILDLLMIGDNIPFKESINKQMESTILLLLSWNDQRDAGTITGKIYEYFGARRPILALAYPDGEIDKLLKQTGSGVVSNRPEVIKTLILTWLGEFKKEGKIITDFHPHLNIINGLTRKRQTQELAEVFNKIYE